MPILVFLAILFPWINPVAFGPSPTVAPIMVTGAAAVVLWWIGAETSPRREVRSAVAIGLVLLLCGAIGIDNGPALALGLLIMLLSGLSAIDSSPKVHRQIAWAWTAAAVLSTGIGLLQYFGVSHWLVSLVDGSMPGQAYANLRQRNQFATLTMIGLAAIGWLAATGLSRRWLVPLAMLVAIGNAASASRTGLLQLVALVILAIWWARSWRAPVMVPFWAALLTYVIAAPVLPWLLAQAGLGDGQSVLFRFGVDEGCNGRRVLWANVLALVNDKPWLGWGWGNLDYAHYMKLYEGDRFCDILDNAHNLPLHLAVELGVPAAVLLCGYALWLIVRARPWSERDDTRRLAWAVVAVIGVHSLLEYPLWYGPFQMALGLAVGLLWSKAESPGEPPRASSALTNVSPLRTAVAVVMGAALMYGAWDYHRVLQVYMPPQERDPAYRTNTMAKAQKSWLFHNSVDFALLTTTEVRRHNAFAMHALALDLLHYSPEPRVIEKVIESATLLGYDQEALEHAARYRTAFPGLYAEWSASHALPSASAASDPR